MTQEMFGGLLRRHRLAQRLTQAELAKRAAISVQTVSALERGLEAPRVETVALLAAALHLPPQDRAGLEAAPTGGGSGTRRRGDNLPYALTPFVGREREVAAVWRLVGEHRLVTLTGTGGVGKTRLALETARRLLPVTPHGVWLVELAPLADPGLVLQTVAAVLGVEEDAPRAPDPLATLVDALRPQHLLLLLDNCEHVVKACAQLVDDLSRARSTCCSSSTTASTW